MLFGRLMGWVLIALAVVMASADAVLALGPAEYAGIITADVVTLLAGYAPAAGGDGHSPFDVILDLPAWVAVGLMGLSLAIACRKRPRARRFLYRGR